MHIITTQIAPSEPCHGIFEGPQNGRWVQKVWVIRGDAIARYETDLGPEEDFATVTPLVMPGFGDESVAAFQWWAEKNRHDDYWTRRAEEMLAESTLIKDHANQAEQDWAQIENRSVFGPVISVQRNVYDPTVAARKLSQRRQEYTGIIPQRGRR